MYRLFGQRDNEGARRPFDPEIEWVQMKGFPCGGHYAGVDVTFDGVFAGFRKQWEVWRAIIERCLDAGESVVVLGFYEGTYRSTGRSVRAEFAHLFKLGDSRIVRFVQCTDTLKVAETMGLIQVGKAWRR